MKNLLSKSLLCGVLASTFLIVNCQKAPNRGVKAQATPPAKVTEETKTAACSEDAIKEARSAKEIDDALKVALEKVNDKTTDQLTETEKNDLTNLVNNLFDQSNKLIAEIEKITVGDKKEAAEACIAGEKSYYITVIRSTVARMGTTVKEKTGLDNKATPKVEVDSKKLELNDEVTISAELAKLLADETQLNSKSLIVAGRILTAEAEIKEVLARKDVTSCALTLTDKEAKPALVAGAKVLVARVEVRDSADKSKSFDVAFGVKVSADSGMSLVALSCKIAEGKDANIELRSALGALAKVKSVVRTSPIDQPQTPASAESSKASGDSSKASVDSSSASGDGSKARASEALRILDNAMSRM